MPVLTMDTLQYALKFSGGTADRISEYEIFLSAADLPSSMCPGTFVLSAWTKYSADYDGDERVLHSRFSMCLTLTSSCTSWPNACRMFYNGDGALSINPIGVASGAWPTQADEWQRYCATIAQSLTSLTPSCSVQVAFTTDDRELDSFRWYLGFPIRSSKGAVCVTGLEFRRIGPSELKQRVLAPSHTSRHWSHRCLQACATSSTTSTSC